MELRRSVTGFKIQALVASSFFPIFKVSSSSPVEDDSGDSVYKQKMRQNEITDIL